MTMPLPSRSWDPRRRGVSGLLALAAIGATLACSPPDRAHDADGGPIGGQDGGMGGMGGGGAGGSGAKDGGVGSDSGILEGYIYAHDPNNLYRIDTTTLGTATVKVEKVGSFGFAADQMTDLAVTPDDHIYGVSWVGGAPPNKLWEVDATTGKATEIAVVPGSTNVALTFDKDGTLLGADKSGTYRRIDPKMGTVTPIGNWGAGYSAAGDIVGVMDGTLYAIADGGGMASPADNTLVTLDPATGNATEIANIGFGGVWGAAFWCGKVYCFTSDGQIIEVDTKTGKGTSVNKTAVQWWGAGVTPRAPLGGTVGGSCK